MTNGAKAIAVTVIVLIAALGSGLPLLARLSYALMAVLALCAMWAWGSLRWLEIKRAVPARRTQVGRAVEDRFAVRNTWVIPKTWIEIRDYSSLPDHQASQAFGLAPRSWRKWAVRTVCGRRGKYTIGPYAIVTGDPLAIFRRTRVVNERHAIVVYPAVVDLPDFQFPAGDLPGGYASRQRANYVTPNASSVREYAPGDSLNRIHWLSTARNGRLMTKEFELDPTSDTWIILDMQQDVHAGSGQESTEEYGVIAAASLATHFLDRNRAVGLIASATHRETILGDRGTRQMLKILEGLAVFRAEGKIPLVEVIAAEASRFGRGTTLVVITPSNDESWCEALRELKYRGVRVATAILEASTFGGSGSPTLAVGELAAADIPVYLIRKGDAFQQVFVGQGIKQ
ncbi:MAG: DUF58 domain-containing protein [Dehalococcoidales bacterium]|nr:DUF58 domain-containing protein [Dehalococcoidales bacterium]